MFLGQIIIVYAWYNVWDKLAYRKSLHVVFGFIAGFFGLMAMTMIDAVASFMLTPAEVTSEASLVARSFLNQTMVPLNMHRFIGNFSYAGFLIAGWAGFRYLRTTREDDREYYDWMGHFGLLWGFGFLIMQPIIGYGYLKGIRESAPESFNTIMLGDKAWVFNLLALWIAVLSIASTAYFVHKLRFAIKPMETLRKLSVGALGFTALFTVLNVIPTNAEPDTPDRARLRARRGDEDTAGQHVPLEVHRPDRADARRLLHRRPVPEGLRDGLPLGKGEPVEPDRADGVRLHRRAHHGNDGLHARDRTPRRQRPGLPHQRVREARPAIVKEGCPTTPIMEGKGG